MDTIDFTPTWEAVVNTYLLMWDSLNAEGKEIAKAEIMRAAKFADKYVELQKEKT